MFLIGPGKLVRTRWWSFCIRMVGEMYIKLRDRRLGRAVAIKVLPE
jgi:hypothetical protein